MEDFTVDGIACLVSRPVAIYHTGSAPFCYDGDIVIEPSGSLQVTARFGKWILNILFAPDDPDVISKFTKVLRRGIKRSGSRE